MLCRKTHQGVSPKCRAIIRIVEGRRGGCPANRTNDSLSKDGEPDVRSKAER